MGTTVLSHEGREGLWGCDVPTDSSRIPSECRDLGTYFCAVAGLNAQPQWASPPKKRSSSDKGPLPATAGGEDFPAAVVGTLQFSLPSSPKSFLSARSGFLDGRSQGSLCRAEGGTWEHVSTKDMWLSSGTQPTATLSQLGGRAGCVRARALPSVGSPARALGCEKPYQAAQSGIT